MGVNELYQIYLGHSEVCTDSRKVGEGALFFALKGENFDGNQYARASLENGAAYAVVDDQEVMIDQDERYILVKDVLKTLQDLASFHRQQFTIPVLAITGSNGKTTTKELIAATLTSHFNCHATEGNLNNHIGVPLTILGMPRDAEIAIVEMGANHISEIANLCKIARPTHGIITNISKAHLEGFGSLEGVITAKKELFDFLAQTDGIAFVNTDEEHLLENSEQIHKRHLYNQESSNSNLACAEIRLIQEVPFVIASFDDLQVHTKLFGRYNFKNIMGAIVIAKYFGVPVEKIKDAIEGYVPKNNRSQIIKTAKNQIILDAYNANPDSMKNAVNLFAKRVCAFAKKVAILGDMRELGKYSENEHKKIRAFVKEQDFCKVILVGPEFGKIGLNAEEDWFENASELNRSLQQQPILNCCVLIKGSRGIGLEEVLPFL